MLLNANDYFKSNFLIYCLHYVDFSDVSDGILVTRSNSVETTAQMEFVTKLKTFAMDLKTRLLPYVHLFSALFSYLLIINFSL